MNISHIGGFCLLLVLSMAQKSQSQYDNEDEFLGNENNRGSGNFQNQENSEDTEDAEEPSTTVPTTTTTPRVNQTTLDPVHVIGQVNQVLNNVDTLNITGIVDQSLGIRNNAPIRNLVNGILSSVFCNPFFIGANSCNRGKAQWKRPVINPNPTGPLIIH